MKRIVSGLFIVATITIPFIGFDVLPEIGDNNSPTNTHVAKYYTENAVEQTHSPNLVTAVIVDYRAFDTMLETTVMFLAGVAVVLVLAGKPTKERRYYDPDEEKQTVLLKGQPIYRSVNKDVMIKIIEPAILVYAAVVLFHGEISLGGGFQAGALIALVYLLDAMVAPETKPLIRVDKNLGAAIAGSGPLIYALTGVGSLVTGGLFLEFNKLPFNVSNANLHAIGITLVEIGVTVGVAATIITIIDAIMERITFDDDNY